MRQRPPAWSQSHPMKPAATTAPLNFSTGARLGISRQQSRGRARDLTPDQSSKGKGRSPRHALSLRGGTAIATDSGAFFGAERVGLNVQRLKRAKQLSQEELAHRAKIHQTYLLGVEGGKRNPSIRGPHPTSKAITFPVEQLS
jgi:DNA-binding XRE family transcriptional regulator